MSFVTMLGERLGFGRYVEPRCTAETNSTVTFSHLAKVSGGFPRVSNGLPRALNNAATAALIAAAAENKDLVDDACAKKAAAELTRD